MMESVFRECVNGGGGLSKVGMGVVEEVLMGMGMMWMGELMKIGYKWNNEIEERMDVGDGEEKEEMVGCEEEVSVGMGLKKVKWIGEEGLGERFEVGGGYEVKMGEGWLWEGRGVCDGGRVEMMVGRFMECV